MDCVIVAATVVIAISAAVSAAVTWRLSQDNRALRKAETEPRVVAYLALDHQERRAVNFVLANVGRGPARHVEFTLQGEMDDFVEHDVSAPFTDLPTGKGAGMLPQGERIQSFFGMAPTLLQQPSLRPFTVSVTYEDLRGEEYVEEHKLDVTRFGWINWLQRGDE